MSNPSQLPWNNLIARVVAALACVGLAAGGLSAPAATYTWAGATAGVWTNTANWIPSTGFPSVAGDTAVFSQDFTAAYTVNLYTNAVINSLTAR